MITRYRVARAALAAVSLSTLGLLALVLVVFTPLQEIGFRVMALAGIAVPVSIGIATVMSLAGAVFVATGPRPVPRRNAGLTAAAVTVGWVTVLALAGPPTLGISQPRAVDRGEVVAGTEFTIAVQNVWWRDPSPGQLATAVLARSPDVVVLIEFTDAHDSAWVAAAGDDYPYRWSAPADKGQGMALFSRFPIGDVEPVDLYAGAARVPVHVGPATVDLVMVHPMAPSSFWGVQRWTQDMLELTRAGSEPGRQFGSHTVVAGDFNATVHHRRYRDFKNILWLTDALDVVGSGYSATWPGRGKLPPLMRLDHILVGSEIAVLDAGVVPAPGSDHLGVVARLGLAEP